MLETGSDENQVNIPGPPADGNQALIPTSPTVQFTGLRGPLFKLALKNALFTLLTLGIYRFWAKTWIRRYFWHNTRIRGEALEYTGLPSELLIGFLIALAILVPTFMIYKGIVFLLSSFPEIPSFLPDAVYFLSLWALFQFAFYRMWRYRLSRTAWRGIHFGLDGSAWRFVSVAFGWTAVSIMTLGLASPWARVALWRFRVRNTRFGNTFFNFEGSGKHLLMPWLIVWLLPLLVGIFVVIFHSDTILKVMEFQNTIDDPNALGQAVSETVGDSFNNVIIMFVVIGITQPFLRIWYGVRQARYLIGGTQFQEARFQATIKTSTIVWAIVLYLFCITLLIGGLMALTMGVVMGTMIGGGDAGAVFGTAFGAFFGIIFPVLLLILMPVFAQIILYYKIFKHVCSVIEIENAEAFDQAIQSVQPGPKHGEGFADALDVGAM